jgi:hypothetical protein
VSESDQLEGALVQIETARDLLTIVAGIDAALAVKPPAGNPDIIATQADTYRDVANMCDQVRSDMFTVNESSLPASWRGEAAESAAYAVESLGTQAEAAQEAFGAGSQALATWADQLRTAQFQDAQGREQLENAKTQLQSDALIFNPLSPAGREAVSGCHDCWAAASLAADAAADASTALGRWPDQARAQQIRVPGVDALTAVTLAYNAGIPSALSPIAATMASKYLNAMSPADRAAFEKLVAQASSVAEAGYLWKGASAGYSLGQLESFDAVIHGKDDVWLWRHLDPEIVDWQVGQPPPPSGPLHVPPAFDQGNKPYCLADSTAMARLAADPVLMLGVTTGKGPAAVGGAKVGDDSQAAIAARAQTLFSQSDTYYRQHIDRPNIPDQALPPGWPRGAIALDDQQLTPVTGSTYQFQPLDNMADRQAALPKIEAAAEAGKPVPIDVDIPDGTAAHWIYGSAAHQMVVEDYRDGELEIYNPWGFTQWVPAQKFVDGQLGAVTDTSVGGPLGGIPHPYGVQLPE